MTKISLSKSRYVQGWQCPKALFLEKFHPELKDEVTEAKQAVFDAGHTVGYYAQQLFAGGIDATKGDFSDFNAALAYTQELINSGQEIIYEAGFEFEGNLCYLDILVKRAGKWFAYEVKGSTSVHDYYLQDTSYQYYVITNSGLQLEDIFLVHLNTDYVRHGELDLSELFTTVSLKEKVLEMQVEVKTRISILKNMLSNGEQPAIEIGPHCSNPFNCSFMGHCWKDVPDYSVFDIVRLNATKKFNLFNHGIIEIDDIPDDAPLNDKQWLQVVAERENKTFIESDMIRKFISRLEYPLYFMDFETFMSPIPLFDDSQPYRQICFQYSLHLIEKPGGELLHFEYLGTPPTDPRLGFVKSLIENCGTSGTVLTYNKGFETGRLKELAMIYPEHAIALYSIINRVDDLMEPFQKMYYYTPEMRGSYSIKKVLPAVVPELSYKDLEINNGGLASNAYFKMQTMSDNDELLKTRKNLLDYCKMDTYAMVKILEKLEEFG